MNGSRNDSSPIDQGLDRHGSSLSGRRTSPPQYQRITRVPVLGSVTNEAAQEAPSKRRCPGATINYSRMPGMDTEESKSAEHQAVEDMAQMQHGTSAHCTLAPRVRRMPLILNEPMKSPQNCAKELRNTRTTTSHSAKASRFSCRTCRKRNITSRATRMLSPEEHCLTLRGPLPCSIKRPRPDTNWLERCTRCRKVQPRTS